ncbi:probable 39S ribosomal protein L23, mitochondrial [Nephila pilipes]|uniref:Large ribosomal subunit protein uL23m n=1 Tax=Nephila pilipes TaxID=299642 RepID=A0A8X6N390_NEPPI|nr:probable 39S ribosomal protein L23, mitochondrial [Nephila pilipes]
MSSRLYPTFVKVPVEMTDDDVKNYLEKIYNTPVTQIRSRICQGEIKKNHKNYLVKDPDYRMACVTLPEDMKFQFPDIFPREKKEKEEKEQKRLIEQAEDLMKQRRKNWDRKDVPTWFGL